VLDIAHVVFGFVILGTYAASSYLANDVPQPVDQLSIIWWINCVVYSWDALYYLSIISILSSSNRVAWCYRYENICYLTAIISGLITLVRGDTFGLVFLKFIKSHKVYMKMEATWFTQVVTIPWRTRVFVRIAIDGGTFILVFACVMILCQSGFDCDPESQWTLSDGVFFVVVTMSTVGYGDKYPTNWVSRLAAMVLIVAGGVFFVTRVSQLIDLYSDSQNGKGSYSINLNTTEHVIVTGDLSDDSLMAFLTEFFHPDHAAKSSKLMQVVVLSDQQLSKCKARINSSTIYGITNIKFFKGSVLNNRDLQRVKAHKAVAVFILSFYMKDDNKLNSLRAIAFRRFNPNIPIYSLINNGRDVPLLLSSGIKETKTLQMHSVKMTLASMNFIAPGAATLFSNLSMSLCRPDVGAKEDYKKQGDDGDDGEEGDAEAAAMTDGIIVMRTTVKDEWLEDYLLGASQEIYEFEFASSLHGKNSRNVMMEEFKRNGMTLVGIICAKTGSLTLASDHSIIAPGDRGLIITTDLASCNHLKEKPKNTSKITSLKLLERRRTTTSWSVPAFPYDEKDQKMINNFFQHFDMPNPFLTSRVKWVNMTDLPAPPMELQNHVVIFIFNIGFNFNNLKMLIANVRSVGNEAPIVMVTECKSEDDLTIDSTICSNLYFVNGAPLDYSSIFAAVILSAGKVFILPDLLGIEEVTGDSLKNVEDKDADVMFLTMLLEKLVGKLNPCLMHSTFSEFFVSTNSNMCEWDFDEDSNNVPVNDISSVRMKLLEKSGGKSGDGKASSGVAGKFFTPNTSANSSDRKMSASERRATLTKGSTGIHLSQNEEEDIFLTSSKYASGMAFNSQMFPAMLAQLYHNPSWLKFIKFFFSQDSDNAFIVVHESIPESVYKAAHVAGENYRYIYHNLTPHPFPQLSLTVCPSPSLHHLTESYTRSQSQVPGYI
jgi:hypothetical protein